MIDRRHIQFDHFEFDITYKEFADSDNTACCNAEIAFSPNDRVILDELNIERLDRKLSILLPAIAYSHALAGGQGQHDLSNLKAGNE